jgi:hypothetical protein
MVRCRTGPTRHSAPSKEVADPTASMKCNGAQMALCVSEHIKKRISLCEIIINSLECGLSARVILLNMQRAVFVFSLFLLNASGILLAQKAADPTQRYFRIIALVHLTGSGQAGDAIVPEYVVQGTAVAVAARTASTGATTNPTAPSSAARPAVVAGVPVLSVATATVPTSSRPGYLAWQMQITDDRTMAIIQIVAADHHAFDSILADTRPEIHVFEIGRDSAATIQATMQQYKKDFNLGTFKVVAQ